MTLDWKAVRHFAPEEWGHDPSRVAPELVLRLDAVREAAGVPLHVHVAFDRGGHSPASRHYATAERPLADAVDFHFDGQADLSPLEEFALLAGFGFGGMGYYPDWLPRPGWHVDLRPASPSLVWVRAGGAYRYGPRALAQALAQGTALASAQAAAQVWVGQPGAADGRRA
ncbi:MAG: hypothetical protein AB7E47_09825 [Desulfovibrionaceae bacterium]